MTLATCKASSDSRLLSKIVFEAGKSGKPKKTGYRATTYTCTTYTYDSATLALDTETITYNIPGIAPITRVLDRSQDNLNRDTGWQFGALAPADPENTK